MQLKYFKCINFKQKKWLFSFLKLRFSILIKKENGDSWKIVNYKEDDLHQYDLLVLSMLFSIFITSKSYMGNFY